MDECKVLPHAADREAAHDLEGLDGGHGGPHGHQPGGGGGGGCAAGGVVAAGAVGGDEAEGREGHARQPPQAVHVQALAGGSLRTTYHSTEIGA